MLYRVLPLMVLALAFVFLTSAPVVAEDAKSHEGVVVKAGDGKLTMTDKDGKNEHSHDVAADAKISCNGKECKLEDLKKGTQVRVTVDKKEGKDVATKIVGKKS